MKKILIVSLALVMALSLAALTGCGKEKKAPETTAAPTTTTEATTTTEKETTEKVTYKTLYLSKLDALLDSGSVNNGRLLDLDGSGTPEMILFRGAAPEFSCEVYTIEDNKVVSLYEKQFTGLRYWQSDASYEAWINESNSPTALVLFDSSDEWLEDKVHAVTFDGGVAEKELLAKAKGEPSTPDWSECKCTVDGETVSAGEYEVERDKLSVGADIVNPSSSDIDSLRSALREDE